MDTKQFENKRWSGFDSRIGFRHKAALEMVLSGSVLDLGAGDGVFLEMLGESFEDKIGLDISEEAFRRNVDLLSERGAYFGRVNYCICFWKNLFLKMMITYYHINSQTFCIKNGIVGYDTIINGNN